MFVEFKNAAGDPVWVNADHIMFVQPSSQKVIGIVELVLGIQVLMNGQIAQPNLQVQGTLKEVAAKLNGRPTLSAVN